MESLKRLLDDILHQTTFNVSAKSRRNTRIMPSGGFSHGMHTRRIGELSPGELRKIHENNSWQSGEWGETLSIQPVQNHEMPKAWQSSLESLLQNYVSAEGLIGHAITDSIEGPVSHKISQNGFESTEGVSEFSAFCDYLLVATSVIGSDRMTAYIHDWVAGRPLRYKTVALLAGVTTTSPLALPAGMSIRTLPTSSIELPQTLLSYRSDTPENYLGAVVLEVDSYAKPAMYKPMRGKVGDPQFEGVIQHDWVLSESSLDQFCESLSLACNSCVRYKQTWRDFRGLNPYSGLSSKSWMPMRNIVRSRSEVHMTIDQLESAWEVHCKRDPVNEPRYLKTAIGRWMKSKRPESDIVDQFIDLRIALEALFLNTKHRGSLALRVATHGSLFLVKDYRDRRSYYATLSDAYDLASAAVHTGKQRDTPENRELLTKAQDICRDGILKVLANGTRPDWDSVILGYPTH